MADWGELREEDVAANRSDQRHAVIISAVAFLVVVGACVLIVIAGVPAP